MADGDREVLSSLPRTRPERRSAKRGARTGAAAAGAGATAKAAPKAAAKAAKPRAAAKPRTAGRSKSGTRAAARAVPPRKIPPAGYAVPKQDSPVQAGGTELVGTAIQAVGELAGLGSRALRDILGRLPRP